MSQVSPVPFLKLFQYASNRDLLMLVLANIMILYSSLNIPLVNIVYGLMMRSMNDFVANRAKFQMTNSSDTSNIINYYETSTYLPNTGFQLLTSEQSNETTTITTTTRPTTTTIATTTTTATTATTIPIPDLTTPLNGSYQQVVNTSPLPPSSTMTSYTTTEGPASLAEAEENFMNESYKLCTIVIIFGVTRLISLYLGLLLFNIAAANQARRVKILFFRSLLRQEVAWFECNRTGDFAYRLTSDLSKFEEGIGEKIALCLNALFAWMSSVISSFYYGWELTLVCLILVPLTIIITTVIAEFQANYSIKESAAMSRAFNVCHEVLSSIRTIFAYSGQQKECKRFKNGLDSAYKHGIHRNIYSGLNLGFTWMSGYLGFAICLLYSTKFYQPQNFGTYDEAQIITILWSAAGCVFLLNRMMPFIEVIQMARGSAANIFSVIERQSRIDVTSRGGLNPKHFEAHVKFDKVCFTYPKIAYCESEPATITRRPVEKNIPIIDTNSKLEEPPLSSSVSSNVSNLSPGGQQQKQMIAREDGAKDNDEASDDSESIERATLMGVSMEAEPGQTIALVGPSGSGKSTALSLLQRFFEIHAGQIFIGGYDIQELNLGWLRQQFGVVTQEPILFDMSIADNIRLGARPGHVVTQRDIELAARNANAHYFIKRLPSGYDTRAGTRGIQLSGGQKQRIAIARALIRQPKILLLDEATSALDLESESIVQRALDQARIGRTTFIVAHRLSTVRNADKIMVFDKGTVVESGTHEELLQRRGLYHQINAQQKHGLDLILSRRDSQLGAEFTRDSRSVSIYSTGGKFTGFGGAGHGGNGEGLGDTDQHSAHLQEDPCASGLYDGQDDEEEHVGGYLDGESLPLFNSDGRCVQNLSIWSILKFIQPDPVFSTMGIITSLLMGLCIPISAMIIGDIANLFSTDDPEKIRHGLYTHGLLYTGLALFAFTISFVQVLTFGVAGEKIGINLRIRGFEAILRRNITWFDSKRNGPGALCGRLASDVGNVQTITGSRTAVIFQSISILVTTFIFAIYFNLKFSSICALFVAILLMATVLQAHYAGKLTVSNREFDSNIGKIVLESSSNIKTVVSLHQEEHFLAKFEHLLNKDRRSFKLDNHLRLFMESLKYAMTAISKGSAFYFAAHMLLRNEITIDVIFKLIEIILYGLTEASKSLIFISDLEKARRGAQNLYKLIYLDQSYDNSSGKRYYHQARAAPFKGKRHPVFLCASMLAGHRKNNRYNVLEEAPVFRIGDTTCHGNINFQNVSFTYPSRPDDTILRSLSVEIPAGKSIALVGRSGCGKSTIVQLLERFYEHSDGSITLDGQDLRYLPVEWLRKQIALVSQEPTLLSYTIGDNIRYGDNSREVPFDEVVIAAQTAQIHEFIMSLPDKYDTKLSESNSMQLSGGQKQRIAIARALIRQAPIMVFDEATSALDSKSENIVQQALEHAQQGKTSIVIAHRLSTIKNADKILVLKDGLVIEQGTHNELLERRAEYYRLYKTQSKMLT